MALTASPLLSLTAIKLTGFIHYVGSSYGESL